MKNYSELTLTDDYLFSQVMKDESVCKPFLEMLLEIKIAKIEYLQEQKELNLFPDSKGVRLDVYLEGDGKVYNIEMQAGRDQYLICRMRYYRAAIDIDMMMRGSGYRELKPVYIIFLCRFDPIGKGLARYTLRKYCEETGEKIDDGQTEIVYNVNAYERAGRGKVRELLRYLATGEAQEPEVKEFAEKIARFKETQQWRKGNMKYELDLQDARIEGKEEGIAEGIEIGRSEGLDEGLEKGHSEGRYEMAVLITENMMKQGLTPEQTAALTGLTVDEVEALRKRIR